MTRKFKVAVAGAAESPELAVLRENAAYDILPFAGLDKLISNLAATPPDLLIVGNSAPQFEGWRACRLLRAAEHVEWNHVPILLVSRDAAEEESRHITAKLGGDGWLSLPAEADRLGALAQNLLDRAVSRHSESPYSIDLRLQEAVRDGGAAYFFIGPDGRFRYVNKAWCRMHGYSSPDQAVGLHFSATQIAEDQTAAHAIVATLLSGTPVPAGEFRRKRQDGSTGYHTFSAHTVRCNGNVIGLEGFLIDTSRLHELEDRYEWLFNSMLDAFAVHEMIFDADGKPVDYRFLRVNPAFERMTGLTASAVEGRTVLEILPHTETHWIENYGRVVLTGDPFRFEASHSGLGKHFEVIAFRPVTGQFACAFRDITDRKRHQTEIEKLSRLYAVLSQVNQAIVRIGSRDELFHSICEVAGGCGGFRQSWVSPAKGEAEEVSLRGASETCGAPCPPQARVCALVQSVASTGLPVVYKWSEPSVPAGLRPPVDDPAGAGSCAAFPLSSEGRVSSVLCLNAADPEFFSEAEVGLLEEVSLDISFALDKLEAERREKQVREALKRSEALHRALFENLNDAVFLAHSGPQGQFQHFVAANAVASVRLGYSREELSNLCPADIEPEGAATGNGTKFETVHVAKNGRRIPVEVLTQELDLAGEHLVLSIARDITERRQAEDAVRRAQANLAALIESTEDLIWSVDLNHNLLTFNSAFEDSIQQNFERRAFAGAASSDLFPPDRAAALRSLYRAALAMGSYRMEVTFDDGRLFELSFNRIVHDSAPTGISVFGKDVTVRKQTEDELRASEKRYRLISENTADVIWTLDIAAGRFTYVSPSVTQLRGFTVEEALSQTLEQSFTPASYRSLIEGLRERLHTLGADNDWARRPRTQRVEQPCKAGSIVLTEVVTTLLCDDDGRPSQLLGVSRDIGEQRRAELALEESERRLALALDATNDGLFDWNMAENHAYFSPRYYTMLGYAPDEFPANSESFLSLIHPDDISRLVAVLDEYADGRRDNHEIEIRLRTKDGGWRWVLSRGRMVQRLPDGRPAQMIGTHVDVTDRKLVEERLKENEEKFRTAFMTVADVFYIARWEDGLILDVNDRLEQVLGYTREEAIGKTSIELGLYFDLEDRAKVMREVRERGCVRDFELRGKKKNGEIITGLLSINRFGLNDDLIIGVVKDISDRKRSELALRESEERFSQAFRHAPLMMAISDFDTGVFIEVNEAFSAITGFGREDAIGRSGVELGIISAEEAARCHRLLEEGGQTQQQEMMLRRNDGTSVICSIEVVSISLGTIRRSLLIGVDLTTEKRRESEKAHLEEQLQQSQKLESIGRLAGGIAHDFNNMLTVINGYSELMVRALRAGDPLRESARQIQRAGEQATSLTRQLLAFSRKQVIDPRPISLNYLLAGNRNMLQRLVGEDIELTTVLAPDLRMVLADAGQMIQVVMNLVVNARDAMPAGGTVLIETAGIELDGDRPLPPGVSPGPHVMLVVADTGTGMDPETQQRIFEPFFTTKGEGVGTGLGLSTAYGLVRQFGGGISVESAPGCGSTFRIYLPAIQAAAGSGAAESAGDSGPGGNETILVVEDQEAVRNLVVHTLRQQGYRVLEAAHGPDALAVADRHPEPIHLMLSDVVMPRMKGNEVAARLKPLRPEMRVLFMSGYAEEIAANPGGLGPDFAYIAKPFSPDALIRRIREVLGAKPHSA